MAAEAFEALYQKGRPGWDVDGPKQFVVQLHAEGEICGDVLDSGCGTGENALFLAGKGFRVIGIDAAPTAIGRAKAKSVERNLDVEFRLEDVTDLRDLDARFDTVIDSGLFHTLGFERERKAYANGLRRACRPGALVHILAFRPGEFGWAWEVLRFVARLTAPLWPHIARGTHGVTKGELLRAFAEGWVLGSMKDHSEGQRSFHLFKLRRL